MSISANASRWEDLDVPTRSERGHSCPQQAPNDSTPPPLSKPSYPSDVAADRNVRAPVVAPRHARFRFQAAALLALFVGAFIGTTAHAALTVLGVQYQQDNPYPEFQCLWHDGNYPTSCGSVVTGANVHVFLKNTGASAVTVNDVTLASYSLATVIEANANYHNAQSIYFHWDTPPQDILNAGEPVWYKADPSIIPAGGVAQVVVRLRTVPVTQPVSLGVVSSAGTVNTNVPVDGSAPVLANVGFSSDLTKVYLHWRRTGGAAPTKVLLDGTDVTANTATVGDASVNFAESVLTLGTPLTYMSYHVFQGVYADGTIASGSLRAWSHPFLYASWGVFPCGSGDTACAKAWIQNAVNHGFNAAQNQLDSGGVNDYLNTSAGQAYAAALGYGFITWNSDYTGYSGNPMLSFTDDEPDAEEANIACGTGLMIPCGSGHTTGILAMRDIATGQTFRSNFPLAPTTINMDGNLKPDNYYSYGQSMDVLMVDPYYQRRLSDSYWYYTQRIPLYQKATYNYAVARAVTTSAEPNPAQTILYSCEWKDTSTGNIWPFPTPESKRIEVYYSLAAGAKGISYWWFKPGYPSNGLGAQTPTALALWKEMGLFGNEIKTASPLLVTSHPVDMPLTPSANVWARALAVGTDTMIVLVVNDNYYNDQAGCHYTVVGNATVTATLPSWMQASPTAFEISAGGLNDVSTTLNGSQLQLNLGTLSLTRMIVVTTNPQLRGTLQQRYDQQVRPGICAIAPELCVNSPPSIAQQPSDQTVAAGGTANFTLVVSGTSLLSYQWQKNTVMLANGGHYSGCASATLTIANADINDAASFRCVVTNAFGSVTSNPARLFLGTVCSPAVLLNGSFEGPGTGGLSTNWVSYQRSPNPTTVWSIQTASPPAGGGTQYQQIANTSSLGGGGVRQDITGCSIGATYLIAGWMRGNSASATCTVKCSPTASTAWSSAIDLKPPQTCSTNNWVAFSGTVVATGTNMTLWLDGQTGGTGLNKAECFDGVTVTCVAGPPPLYFASAAMLPHNQVRLVLSGPTGGSVTIGRSSDLLNWQPLTNLVNTTGTLQFTDAPPANTLQRFYRATSP